jgi:NAD(P)-dependent dehydrogenase (short-subunit alcohol dehydrogenase family)
LGLRLRPAPPHVYDGTLADLKNLLEGKSALVTGGANGMGRAAARLFASHGASVGVVDVAEDLALEVAEQIEAEGGRAIGVRADVASEKDLHDAVETVASQFGGLHVLVNNAGVSGGGNAPIEDMPQERWDRTFDVNLRAHLLAARAAFPWLKTNGGAIVGTSSSAGLTGLPGSGDYAVSKTGVIALTRQLAAEWGKYGIRVNCISPGVIDTGFGRPRQRGQERPATNPDRYAFRTQFIPLGRIGNADDIARVMLFLASDLSSFVTGQNILVDGGELTNVKMALGWGR